jgi:bifunctional DNase/RNase
MDKLVEVYVRQLSFQNDKGFRIIELGEIHGDRMMQIVIGNFEAEYIAASMDNKIFRRPMPYDVIEAILKEYHILLSKIIIFSVHSNVIYSKLILCRNGDAEREVVVRISDALALAIQTKVPIYIEQNLIDSFFKSFDEKAEQYASGKVPLSDMDMEELQREMQNAVESENYDRAAEVRDEISRRTN